MRHLLWNARMLLRVKGCAAAVRYVWRASAPSTQANVIAIGTIIFGAVALTTIGIADARLHPAPVAVDASCSTDTECMEYCPVDDVECDGGPAGAPDCCPEDDRQPQTILTEV